MDQFIPVCEPALLGNETRYVLECLESGWISSSGEYVAEFEKAFARYCGVAHGIAVCNGTVALHLSLVAAGIGRGDEVIIPDFTMISSAFAVCYTGATPVFVDAEAATWNIDPELIEGKITLRTKAIMPVHIYGHPCNMNVLSGIAGKHHLTIIEDAAEAHGAEHRGRKVGSLGHLAAFSFFANKNITTGEGGMVLTDDPDLADRCRYYKNLCFPLNASRTYVHDDIGFNYRMSNLHAAIGLAQVEKADYYRARRIENHNRYKRHLADVPGIILQPNGEECLNVFWMNGIVVDRDRFGHTRDELSEYLRQHQIETRNFFVGMHKQPSLIRYAGPNESYPVTEWLGDNGLYLPSSSLLNDDTIGRVCEVIGEFAVR